MKFIKKSGKVYLPTEKLKKISFAKSDIYKQSKNPVKFWDKLAKQGITWTKPWTKTYQQKGIYFKWFINGKLNVCYNAVDRHLSNSKIADKPAIIFIPEPINQRKQIITYRQLYQMINQAANMLLKQGIKKGDVVAIYMPMVPETFAFMLACSRIGAIHSVVFSAFSSEALRTRIIDGKAKLLVTMDKYYRKGKTENLKKRALQSIKGISIKKIIIPRKQTGKFLLKNKKSKKEIKIIEPVKPVEMDSEDPLFILFTSGTTGRPKACLNTTGGYAVQAYWSTKFDFNVDENSIMWCTADIGWITGHTYALYGPLLNGSTTLIYEGMLDWPFPDRFLKIIQENKVNVFYTAPTALRLFALHGSKYAKKYNLNSLKVLGSVGEPIDESTWKWFFNNIGKSNLPVIDTWWQTETGSSLINSLPGVGPFIPTFAGKNFPGTKHLIVNEKGKKLAAGKPGNLVQLSPFAPGMLRGIWNNKKRYKKYFKYGLYFTGDNAFQDKKGNFRILGRSDDIIKVAGHRLSTAELENIIESHKDVAEAAVVPRQDKIKGEVPVVFVKLKLKAKYKKITEDEIIALAIKKIGPIAKPSEVYFVEDLPKTRSGKIIRRILKSLLRNEPLGDLSTLVNPESIKTIQNILMKRENKEQDKTKR